VFHQGSDLKLLLWIISPIIIIITTTGHYIQNTVNNTYRCSISILLQRFDSAPCITCYNIKIIYFLIEITGSVNYIFVISTSKISRWIWKRQSICLQNVTACRMVNSPAIGLLMCITNLLHCHLYRKHAVVVLARTDVF
jgi:hypothetical protein